MLLIKIPSILLASIIFITNSIKISQVQTTLLLSNHYYNPNNLNTTYLIPSLKLQNVLILILLPYPSNLTYQNIIKASIISGSSKTVCVFQNFNDLCVLNPIQQQKAVLELSCNKLPCEINFTLYESNRAHRLDQLVFSDLYNLEQSNKHVILDIKCNNPNIKDYSKGIEIYSSNPFQKRIYLNNIKMIFNSTKAGYLYFNVSKQIKSCTKIETFRIKNGIQTGQLYKDFIQKKPNVYELTKIPENDLRIDISFNENTQILSKQLIIILKGINDEIKSPQLIHKYNITINLTRPINILFPKSSFSKFYNLFVQIQSISQTIFIQFQIFSQSIQQIDYKQLTYFWLQQSSKVIYEIQQQQASDDQSQIIQLSNQNEVVINKKYCKMITDCRIVIKSINKTEGVMRFKGQIQQPKYIQITKNYSSKIRQHERLYLIHKTLPKSTLQIIVNTQNVFLYISDQKCLPPSNICYNYSGNSYHPIYIQSNISQSLYIVVIALHDSKFNLRIQDSQSEYIILHDGQPFTYNLNKQNKLSFKFIVNQISDVDFNLIAPLNTLIMYVNNNMSQNQIQASNLKSFQGYISLRKKQLISKQFMILIEKVNKSMESVHFTLIASSNKAIIPLQISINQYETLQYHKSKTYIIESNMRQNNVIQFYSYGVSNINISVQIQRNLSKLLNSKSILILTTHHLLQLKTYLHQYCTQDQDYCQVYMRVYNNLNHVLDLVVTFLAQDSIIEIKDGIWQSYSLATITTSCRFYFIPKHQNNTINIIYNSTNANLTIIYKLLTVTNYEYNKQSWPFPQIEKNSNEYYNHVKQISISSANLHDCWPNCVLLLSLVGFDSANIEKQQNFKVMVTNDVIELMQHEKLELVFHKNQEKIIIIDLKNLMNKLQLQFFVSYNLGEVMMYGSVSSNKNMRIPTIMEYDFYLQKGKNSVSISSIQQKLKALKMQNDTEFILKIVFIPFKETKLRFEFYSNSKNTKVLNYDSYQSIILESEKSIILQFFPRFHYRFKIIRNKGSPLIQVQSCQISTIQQCIINITDLQPMNSKIALYEGNATQQLSMVIKIEAKQMSQLDLYVQSDKGALQLKEGVIINDFSMINIETRYLITAIKQKITIITIHISQGNPKVHVKSQSGFQTTVFSQNNLVHISIPPNIKTDEKRNESSMHINSFGLNYNFENIHIQMIDIYHNSTYTISYTTGQRNLQLQDGLPTKIMIEKYSKVTFFYQNSKKQTNLNILISFQNLDQLKNTSIKIIYYNRFEQNLTQMVPNFPEAQNKTLQPSITFPLPKGYQVYECEISNIGHMNNIIQVIINQNQFVLLPFGFEFPIELQQNKNSYFLTQVNSNQGYLLLSIRKCDYGVAIVSYKYNSNSISVDEYTFESEIKQQAQANFKIKAQVGTFYIKIFSQSTLRISLKISYFKNLKEISENKLNFFHKNLQFQLINSLQAELTISPIICEHFCNVSYSYYISKDLRAIYNQLICPSNFFNNTKQLGVLKFNNISVQNPLLPIKFEINLLDQINYIGVLGLMEDGRQFYYQPLQIVTIWGFFGKHKKLTKFILYCIIFFLICCGCMLIKYRRRKYNPLRSEQS